MNVVKIQVHTACTYMTVYGAAQIEFKNEFLSELVCVCSDEMLPLLIGGDFNIISNALEKNNDRFQSHWPNLFNAVIESLNLREPELPGRPFTWANYAEVPTYEKLDRILVSTELDIS